MGTQRNVVAMSKKEAWIHVGLLFATLVITPIVSYNFGEVAGEIIFCIGFFSFCYMPIKGK